VSNEYVAQQAQQKKADGLPDPNKREGPVKTAQDIYEEKGLGVTFCIIFDLVLIGLLYKATPMVASNSC
jgi:hypothetical protein